MELKQLDRMENMLTNLIKIVGTLSNEFQVMKEEMREMKVDIKDMKVEIKEMKHEIQTVKNDMEEVKKEQVATNRILIDIRANQDHIWEKAVKNERELAKLKSHLQL
ncbi:putative nucleic acid-binding Zn-ribbon protein [Bacillus sp. SORGH_AS 510]|uniref:hypothetical protein n=1 Tax=Bacillus sp. SORGH_AS_0510 TaxID=3041771 RepID=UPI002783B1C6|nr:hypothetical protein [Bacillus sp. SORGH_AS_0510]MDQ1144012.1 putative nucleic acid-binding Zn-ribbon protein [Bacillus sp. SORGH_AS_0510]